MKKIITLLFLIFISTTGCSRTEKNSLPNLTTDFVEPIAIHETIPKNLIIPKYPEEPINTRVKEYKDGYTVEMTAPNPLVIAKPAWVERFQEQGWIIINTAKLDNESSEWNVLARDKETLFIRFQETFQIIESTDENEPEIKGETLITTYIKK